ncbi:ethanolamine-phosphate phospho-lyase-like [Pollicipes pollicipes]|uniref:ethanolamine-phosphate phospho-lyase-like n=1 Tax=Pollicipes pollicipes TaxID=41117 RepID=UPI00188518A6|nr:ethanolamine-phosphate phospho-lyase-like [Pollicipes pollicipes]XP_037071052.1 ethanolamine-phosphate phospho-lyase-like [Pollicipes pollicipes]
MWATATPTWCRAVQQQMARLVWAQGFLFDALSLYLKELTDLMPEQLSVCYLVNSGSEANDLALRMARAYTQHEDVIVLEGAYHGNLGSVADISPKLFAASRANMKGHVHVATLPDTYRGPHRETEPEAGALYAADVRRLLDAMENDGRRVAAFVSECILTNCGMVVPPADYFSKVYSQVRARGGLCIIDEVQTGLGRIGSHTWAFQSYGVVPDIVTLGKPLGNGHPMSAVITRREIAENLGDYYSTFGGNPVSCAVGLAVLEVMHNEKLMSSATNVGRHLKESLRGLMPKYSCVGDVRGKGLCLGVDIVMTRENRKPDPAMARAICLRLKDARIITYTVGPANNVLLFTPPMCFTMSNACAVVATLDRVLEQLERDGPRTTDTGAGLWRVEQMMDVTSLRDLTERASLSRTRSDDTDEDEAAAKRRRIYEEVD